MATRSEPPPVDLPTVVSSEDRRASLSAIRDRVARELVGAEGRDVAALSKELREVIREIDSLPTAERVTPLDKLAGAVTDDLAQRRASRLADATGT
jgi:hypothetical protein